METSLNALGTELVGIESGLMPENDLQRVLHPIHKVHSHLYDVQEKLAKESQKIAIEEISELARKIDESEDKLLNKEQSQILPEDLKQIHKIDGPLKEVQKAISDASRIRMSDESKKSIAQLSGALIELEKILGAVEAHESSDVTLASNVNLAEVQKNENVIKLDAISVSDAHLATAKIDQGLNVKEQEEISLGGDKAPSKVIQHTEITVDDTDDPEKLKAQAKELLRKSEDRELTPVEMDSLKYLLSRINSLGHEIHETLVDAKVINQNTADIIEQIKSDAQHDESRTPSLRIGGDTSIGDSKTIVKFDVGVEVDEFAQVDVHLVSKQQDTDKDTPKDIVVEAEASQVTEKITSPEDTKMDVEIQEIVLEPGPQTGTTEVDQARDKTIKQARTFSLGRSGEEDLEKSQAATIEDVSMVEISQLTSEEQESDIFSDRSISLDLQQEDVQEISSLDLQELRTMDSAQQISQKQTIQLLEELQICVAGIQENILMDSTKEAESFQKSSLQETLVTPLANVQRCIAEIKDILVMETTQSISSENFVALQKLATPMQEVVKHLKTVSSQEVVEPVESMSTQDNLSLLKTVAHPLQELQNCIATLREEPLVIEQTGNVTSLDSLTIAKPIKELRDCVAAILANVVEPSEDISTMEDISALKTIAEDVAEIRDDAAIVQEPGISSEISDEIPTISTEDRKVYAQQLLTDLEHNLASVRQQCVLEEAQSLSEKSPSLMEALAKPIEEVEKCLATIKMQKVHEEIGKESQVEVISDLHDLAIPLQKLEQSIATVQEEILTCRNLSQTLV
uniref:Uncharacterized protein n=1 Tax=Phlebotomus papatasi TaxID=29031 RepID=A0A1B0D851_PHLPP